ncbi:hypothetical protein [Paracoccus shandongensis]|uniref:hypothetical protein n=1 Tax=Paracoccus shandongensis TaxID=2816048 RepID=UPI001A8CC971|nr:hypothetical protein [Paracoccus shandongensis]
MTKQFGHVDPDGAKVEIRYWECQNGRIFARLQLWGASSDLTTGAEAARILMKLPDDIFWYPQDRPDVLHAIVSSWPKLDKLQRHEIEQRLLTTSFPWSDDMTDTQGHSAYRRLEYLHALSAAGIKFSFDLAATTKELCKLAPDWQHDATEDAMASNAPKVQRVIEDTDYGPLLNIPVSCILDVATEIAGGRPLSRWESASFKGLSEEKPVRALSALRYSAGQGQLLDWAWQSFLGCPQRENDSRRLACAISHVLCHLEATKLARIAYSVAHWMEVLKVRLYGDVAEIFDPLWNAILIALSRKLSDEATHRNEGWAMIALNSPTGRLVELLLADPSLPNLADGKGLPSEWKQRAERLLVLPGAFRCHALVMLGHHFVYLYAADPPWIEKLLVPAVNSQTEEADAILEGFLWGARVPSPDLFRQIKPGLLDLARGHTREGQRAENLAGILFYGWAFNAGGDSAAALISDEEFRDALINADDDFRRGILHYLLQWKEQHPEQWNDVVLAFFQKVWPRQRALKTAPLSQALVLFILRSDDLFPELVRLLKSRLAPLRNGGGWLFAFQVEETDGLVKKYPQEALELLWVLLPDDASQWWFEIDKILSLLEVSSDTRGDPRLSEIRRRLARY